MIDLERVLLALLSMALFVPAAAQLVGDDGESAPMTLSAADDLLLQLAEAEGVQYVDMQTIGLDPDLADGQEQAPPPDIFEDEPAANDDEAAE